MKVELLAHMGTDKDVADAALVSSRKHRKLISLADARQMAVADTTAAKYYTYIGRKINPKEKVLHPKDFSLIHYLAEHNHWTPFSHCFLSFRFEAPLFIARQAWRSHVGFSGGDAGYPGWNEESRRYVDEEPTFFLPPQWREAPNNMKQGSGRDLGVGPSSLANESFRRATETALKEYNFLLALGVAAEQARSVLPNCTYTSWVWSGSLYAWARFCDLRQDPHAQKEIQDLAREVAQHCFEHFPVSWGALRP